MWQSNIHETTINMARDEKSKPLTNSDETYEKLLTNPQDSNSVERKMLANFI